MNVHCTKRPEAGLTLIEVGVAVVAVMLVVAMLLPVLARGRRKSAHISCVGHIKQIGLALRGWESDSHDAFPMGISVTNGGSMEQAQRGDAVSTFQVMSNELGGAEILYCIVPAIWNAQPRFLLID